MCGIAGVINVPGLPLAAVEDMLAVMHHRGPDAVSVNRLSERVVIGHARLAVVDIATGGQPMQRDGVWITFNGEIYNYIELRRELEAKGYTFHSASDTEVLLHLWREEGEAMLSRLIGMFAFFIWDTKRERGMLARDRQGIKPCFIARYEGGVAFASEIKAILALPGMVREVNPDALKEVFAFNYCLPPHTCFAGIEQLEAGTYMLFEGEKAPVTKRYWQWPLAEEKRTPSLEEFEALLDDAVRLQMRFDVPGALYLSGGVDSSTVAHHLTKRWNAGKLEAFGLHFHNQEYSEFHHSKEAAALFGINLHGVCVTPEMIPEIAHKVVWHTEQPHGDFSFFLFYLLAQRARSQGKTVMFTGDGPDESLAGQQFHAAPPEGFSMRDYFEVICYMPQAQRQQFLNTDFERATPEPFSRLEQKLEPYRHLSPIDRIVAYEAMYLLPGNNLVKGDRMGSAWSTENRSPFLDHRVSEMFTRLPDAQKFRDGFSKYYLKRYAATKLPHELIFKKKAMPTLPIGEWIKTSLQGWARDILSRSDETYMNRGAVLHALDEHVAGRHNHTRSLRTLIMTQLWLERFIKDKEFLASHLKAG